MIQRCLALGLLGLALGGTAGTAHAQGANICVTQWGWCHLSSLTAPHGIACICLTARNQQVPGITRYMPYRGPASPYLQPHSAPPEIIR